MANTRTVGATGKNHTTIADAVAWFQTAAANHEFGVDGIGTISVEDNAGFSESLDIDDLNYNSGAPTSTSYLVITVASANRQDGVWSESKAHIQGQPTQNALIHIVEDYTQIKYLGVDCDSSDSSDEGIRVESGVTKALISYCVIRANQSTNDQDGIYSGNWACDYAVDNCIIYGFDRGGIDVQNFNGSGTQTVYVDHCFIVNCGVDGNSDEGGLISNAGNSATNNINVYNTGCIDCSTSSAADFQETGLGTHNWTGTHNACSDTSLTSRSLTTGAQESLTLNDTTQVSGSHWLVNEKDSPNYDWLLLDETTYNKAAGNGTDRQGSEPDSRQDFSVDIVGNSRPTTAVDIGANQYTASSSYTLDAASGSYTISGTIASLLHSADLQGSSGTYTYSGTAADLKKGFPLEAASGSYTYSGTTVSLTAARTIVGASGSYTYSGTVASLLAGRALDASSGTYNYNGTEAALTFASNDLSADSGSYTYTGTAAALIATRTVAGESGTYTYSGTSASLIAGHVIAGDNGSYTYVGSSVALKKSSTIAGDIGVYTYSGTDVGFSYLSVTGTGQHIYAIPSELRKYTIESENRTITIKEPYNTLNI